MIVVSDVLSWGLAQIYTHSRRTYSFSHQNISVRLHGVVSQRRQISAYSPLSEPPNF